MQQTNAYSVDAWRRAKGRRREEVGFVLLFQQCVSVEGFVCVFICACMWVIVRVVVY